MRIDLVRLPAELTPQLLHNRSVVVFDVLRATTSIVTAISAGASEVRIFDSLEGASKAASGYSGPRLLCGERQCLPPPGFDLGNSPASFTAEKVAGKTLFISTTNGTRAIVASLAAGRLFVAALVNAAAMAGILMKISRDVTLVCAGTDGKPAPEDMLGAGAIIDSINGTEIITSPAANEALQMFRDAKSNLTSILRMTQGGQNILRAGLDGDIDFAAQLNRFDTIVEIASGDPPVAHRMIP